MTEKQEEFKIPIPRKEGLKFSVYVERKIQVRQYESATVGFMKEYYQDEVPDDVAFADCLDFVDYHVKEMKKSV